MGVGESFDGDVFNLFKISSLRENCNCGKIGFLFNGLLLRSLILIC